jgi:hypothetical protein
MPDQDRNDAQYGDIYNSTSTVRAVWTPRASVNAFATAGYAPPDEIPSGDRRDPNPIVVEPEP